MCPLCLLQHLLVVCVLQQLSLSHYTATVQSDRSHCDREKINTMVAVSMFNLLNMTRICHLSAVIKMLFRKK